MAVEACMTPNLRAEDSDDDDEPLVFKRTKPTQLNSASKSTSSSLRPDKPTQLNSASKSTSSSLRPDKPTQLNSASKSTSSSLRPDKPLVKSGGSDGRSLNGTGSGPQKGSMSPSLKPSSSKPGSVMQKSPPPLSRPQKSPQLNSVPRKSPPLPGRTPPSSVKGPAMKSPSSNGASSVNPQMKKGNVSVIKEEKPSPVKEKSSNYESEDSEDDKPIGQRLSGKGKNSDVKVEDEDSDSDDDKPLSGRVSSGTNKADVKAGDGGRASGGRVQTQKVKAGSVKSPDDSDDEKPLSLKMKSGVASSSKLTQNGSVKKENETKKVAVSSAKRPSAEANSSESLNKKAKLFGASSSAKQEAKDDDDHIPIGQRMNKAASGSKSVPVKKKVMTKVDSKMKKVDIKSKKIIKKSQYSRSSKELPNSGDAQKWTTLEHNGVIFPPPYKPHGVKMLYDGKPVVLTPEQEEVATMYAVMLETDYAKKDKFNENFFNDWKKLLGKNHVIQDLKKCDFTPIYEWHLREKEKKKQMSTEEKKALKEEKMKLEEKYMWAVLDGVKEKVGNFRVEPPGLFRGRGEHPKMGKLKKRIYPSDITINIGKGAPIPECPMPGQRWKEVRHDNTVTWLAYWNDPINPREFKYVFFGASSSIKGQSDKEKYEKARKLKDYIEGIRRTYTKNFTSKDMTKRQIAVATYLIDRLALRAGNEKDDDEADTVGCCTLKVENVKPIPPNILEFDFLGKDSIKYYKQFEAEPLVYKAVEQFREGKQGSDNLFDKLDTSKLNAHLKELMPGLTAKVFRTFNASYTLDDMLVQGAGSGDVQKKLAIYNTANKEVAIICNHQRSVSKTHSAQMERLLTRINDAKAELSELETDLGRAKKGKPPLKDSDGKQKRNLTPEAIEKKMQSIKAKIDKFERDMHTKEEMKEIALGTSKINYLDPRITVAWCKRNEVPIEKIFNKSLIAKFSWAMDAEPDFRF